MDETLSLIRDWVENGGDFFSEQAPLVVQEILAWQYYLHGTRLVLLAGLLALVWGVAQRSVHRFRFRWALAASLLLAPSIAGATKGLAYVLIAPRLVIIDELKTLILTL